MTSGFLNHAFQENRGSPPRFSHLHPCTAPAAAYRPLRNDQTGFNRRTAGSLAIPVHSDRMPAYLQESLLSPLRPIAVRQRLLSPVMRSLWGKCTRGSHVGIAIVDVSFRADLKEEFVRQTIRALELVGQEDPRRHQRICGCFDFIVHMELFGPNAAHWRWPAACVVDFSRFGFERSPEGARVILAATFVHEATHAVLFHRGIPYTSKTRLRVERICYVEETRFVGRINSKLAAGWMERRFKPTQLEQAWRRPGPLRPRLRLLWRRLIESRARSDTTRH